MIKVDNKIRNIYYMLCYSFKKDLLTEKEVSSVDYESFDNIYNLFSVILCMMIRKQIKKGMNKDYINVCDSLSTVKGKINISETIKTNSMIRQKLICDFDEFSENNALNQIIKTTSHYLINSHKIGDLTKKELKKSMIHFKNVDIIEINTINWKRLIFNKNNNSYKNIIVLCELILKGLIASDKEGRLKFREFLDETALHRIYQNFIKEYFSKHYKLNASSRRLLLTEETDEYIGVPETDIVLENDERMLIIDAKFYNHILKKSRFGRKIIDMDNIYQINTYVENQLQNTNKKVYGMLLYAQTNDEPEIDKKTTINRKEIMIKTLDLNKEWNHIKGTLNNIAINFINDTL